MAILSLTRTIVFATSAFISLVVMGISANVISSTMQYTASYYYFTALGVASGVLSLVTLPVFLFIDLTRTGAFTSMIIVEVAWLAFLDVLWLATAADAVSSMGVIDCHIYYGLYTPPCSEMQAVEAFSFLNWILIMGYTITVVVLAIKAANDGHPAWKSSVKELSWSGASDGSAEMQGITPNQTTKYSGYPAGGSQASQQQLAPSNSPQCGNMPHPSIPCV